MTATDVLDGLLAGLPPEIDPLPIATQFAALAPPFTVDDWVIPLPVWATRAFDDGPDAAWQTLRRDLSSATTTTPMCLYLHVPFCARKCDFCDCYSFAMRSHDQATMDRYLDALCGEIAAWSAVGQLAERPVSTVHFGGGTPTHLGPARLRRLVNEIRGSFALSPETELALETTVGGLTPAMANTMDELGFRRVHLGVQSLDDDVRRLIGRRSPAAAVRSAVDAALSRGWILSVDLICGLPEQSNRSFLHDVSSLAAAGVDGFSLYELLVYPQNRLWAQANGIGDGRNHLPNYVAFLAGAQMLEAAGFNRNTFNHWANRRDRNVYFTFPTRGEELLAIGPIADGVFGDYHYRHPRYAPYVRACRRDGVGLQGGLRRTARENELHPLISAILSGRIPPDTVAAIDHAVPGEAITHLWRERRLVDACADGAMTLTASGSWFAGNMVKGLTKRYPQTPRG